MVCLISGAWLLKIPYTRKHTPSRLSSEMIHIFDQIKSETLVTNLRKTKAKSSYLAQHMISFQISSYWGYGLGILVLQVRGLGYLRLPVAVIHWFPHALLTLE